MSVQLDPTPETFDGGAWPWKIQCASDDQFDFEELPDDQRLSGFGWRARATCRKGDIWTPNGSIRCLFTGPSGFGGNGNHVFYAGAFLLSSASTGGAPQDCGIFEIHGPNKPGGLAPHGLYIHEGAITLRVCGGVKKANGAWNTQRTNLEIPGLGLPVDVPVLFVYEILYAEDATGLVRFSWWLHGDTPPAVPQFEMTDVQTAPYSLKGVSPEDETIRDLPMYLQCGVYPSGGSKYADQYDRTDEAFFYGAIPCATLDDALAALEPVPPPPPPDPCADLRTQLEDVQAQLAERTAERDALQAKVDAVRAAVA